MSDSSHFEEVGTGPSHHEDHDHTGVGKYLMVFLALCVLTAISFVVGNSPIMDTPSLGWALMMAVSCAKALLVMMFFMHLIWEANWKYVLTIPASIMSVFLVVMLSFDIGGRTWWYSEERWLHAAEPQVEHADDQGHEDTTHESHEQESHANSSATADHE